MPAISAIYAISENQVIGKENSIPWRLSADLKRYKQLTMGKPILMGRKTFESIGRPLPGRRNIIITRNPHFAAEGIETTPSLESAIQLCGDVPEIFIVGGSALFQEGVEKGYISKIYETLVHADIDGDTFFRLSNVENWTITEIESHQADEKNEFAYTYRTLVRKVVN
ncbi:MAG: dihydrofolate reductase [Bacteroidia bacterium]|nr:dihydrofolate reductase [Bacteroidia bacterium]